MTDIFEGPDATVGGCAVYVDEARYAMPLDKVTIHLFNWRSSKADVAERRAFPRTLFMCVQLKDLRASRLPFQVRTSEKLAVWLRRSELTHKQSESARSSCISMCTIGSIIIHLKASIGLIEVSKGVALLKTSKYPRTPPCCKTLPHHAGPISQCVMHEPITSLGMSCSKIRSEAESHVILSSRSLSYESDILTTFTAQTQRHQRADRSPPKPKEIVLHPTS